MKRLNTLVVSGLFAIAAAVAPVAHSAIISGTWNFSAGGLTGSFSFNGLDTSQIYFQSTAAGFSASPNFVSAGSYVFDLLSGGNLSIGAAGSTATQAIPAINDWLLSIDSFPTNPTLASLVYFPTVGSTVRAFTGTVTAATAPEPATLALLGLGLAGLGFARRKQ